MRIPEKTAGGHSRVNQFGRETSSDLGFYEIADCDTDSGVGRFLRGHGVTEDYKVLNSADYYYD